MTILLLSKKEVNKYSTQMYKEQANGNVNTLA